MTEKDDTDEGLGRHRTTPTKHVVVVQTAPSVRATLGEEFGLPIGTNVEGKMVAALRRLGFDKVFDTDFGADLTIMEEANEFVDRVKNGGMLPMITSCSPGWVKFCEHYYPDLLDNLSTCKSPQQMIGAVDQDLVCPEDGHRPQGYRLVCPSCPAPPRSSKSGRDDEDAAGVPGRGHRPSPPASWPA